MWTGDAIAGLTEPLIEISEAQRNLALKRLEDAKLLTVHRSNGVLVSLDAHPLLREYFGQRLRDTQPEAWRAAHRRLYEHLCATTKEGDEPTLEDLQPLYQAVIHACQAGLQQEACEKVYRRRILGGNEHYSTHKLGAFGSDLGAIACFFETPWNRVSSALTEAAQALLLGEASFCLRALGRLQEARDPMGRAIQISARLCDWVDTARHSSCLSLLELSLGEVAAAVENAERAVAYADRSGNAIQQMGKRTVHANAMHLAGRRTESAARFREAEQIQSNNQPRCPLLHSLRGFRYCDLLLAEAEREAGKSVERSKKEELIALCNAVAARVAKTLEWALPADFGLLPKALDHLTLGRAALYTAVLESGAQREPLARTSFPPSTIEGYQRSLITAASELECAVSGLRRAGQQDELPRGLLTRAWLRSLAGPRTGPDSAQSDLDEAWEIAERGPMPLFLADIHLTRARLFFREGEYPWNLNPDGTPRGPEDDLDAAEKLINKCGYHRRDEELADAKEALKHWQSGLR